MHTVRRRQILCIIRIMQYQIWYVLHEIDGLKLTTCKPKTSVTVLDQVEQMQRELIRQRSSGLQAGIWPGVPLYGLVPLQRSQY